jgi:hypothetical protein
LHAAQDRVRLFINPQRDLFIKIEWAHVVDPVCVPYHARGNKRTSPLDGTGVR